jgi:HEAT repeat protein
MEMADQTKPDEAKPAPAAPRSSWLVRGPVILLGAVLIVWLLLLFPVVRVLVVRGAGALGTWTVPFVLRFADDESREVKAAVIEVVRQAGPRAAPSLLARLDDDDPRRRQFAANLLGSLGPCPEAVPALAEMAETEPDPKVREVAFHSLVNAGRGDERAVRALAGFLGHDNTDIRFAAADALSKFGPEAAPATLDLAQALKGPCARVRQAAAEALEQIGPAAKEAVPALKEALKGETDPVARKEMAEALEAIQKGDR